MQSNWSMPFEKLEFTGTESNYFKIYFINILFIAIAVGLVFGIDDSFIEEITTLSTNLILSNQSRKFEFEADRVSLEILQQLGRDPDSMVRFFDKVAAECGEGCSRPSFFDSHPRLRQRRALFE
jgi:predicted Zn-dependent protease